MRVSVRKLIRFVCLGGLLSMALALFLVACSYPVAAAVVCPGCYGMERVHSHLIVDKGMPAPVRRQLRIDAEQAASTVSAFYGAFERQPILVGCSTEECDRNIGGRGAYAVTISTPVVTIVRLSPRGLTPTILSHEFSHVELQRRIGMRARLAGAFPTWFDEGIAVVVSADNRYLKPGNTALERCVRDTDAPLPNSPFEWSAVAGSDHMIYADAACRVLRWMELNGGHEAVLQAIATVGGGGAFQPVFE